MINVYALAQQLADIKIQQSRLKEQEEIIRKEIMLGIDSDDRIELSNATISYVSSSLRSALRKKYTLSYMRENMGSQIDENCTSKNHRLAGLCLRFHP